MRTQTAPQEIWTTTTTRVTGLRDVYNISQAYSMFFLLLFSFLLTFFLLFFTATDYDDEDTSEMTAMENDKEKGDEGE